MAMVMVMVAMSTVVVAAASRDDVDPRRGWDVTAEQTRAYHGVRENDCSQQDAENEEDVEGCRHFGCGAGR